MKAQFNTTDVTGKQELLWINFPPLSAGYALVGFCRFCRLHLWGYLVFIINGKTTGIVDYPDSVFVSKDVVSIDHAALDSRSFSA
jgi:hypothetical protein